MALTWRIRTQRNLHLNSTGSKTKTYLHRVIRVLIITIPLMFIIQLQIKCFNKYQKDIQTSKNLNHNCLIKAQILIRRSINRYKKLLINISKGKTPVIIQFLQVNDPKVINHLKGRTFFNILKIIKHPWISKII